MKGDVNMMKVVKMFDENCVMGTVKGLTWNNKNGATRKFISQKQLDKFLEMNLLKIVGK